MAQRPLYRQEALDSLASPEELDHLMQITRPGSWLLMAGFGVMLLMVLFWGVFGRITTPLEESGTLVLSNAIVYVPASASGSVLELGVEPGDFIAAGIPVARISTPNGVIPVTSSVNGRVISVRVDISQPVDAGTPLFSVAATGTAQHDEEVIAYVPLEDRQRIRPGMAVQIMPSTVEREKYGHLEGEVISVAAFAATRAEMLAVLGDEGFVERLDMSGPLFEVRISLAKRPNGNYRWSASDGPENAVVLGTPCLVRIIISRERPINKVFNLS